MAEYELRERGYFWWTDETPPDHMVAPDTGAFGELRITRKGEIELDLDSMLPTKTGPFENIFYKDRSVNRLISGVLKKINQHVLLLKIRRGAASANSGFLSFQTLHADMCLVGPQKFSSNPRLPKIKAVHIPLSKFEEWLWLRDIKIVSTKRKLKAEYIPIPDDIYRLEDRTLRVVFDLWGPFRQDHKTDHAEMRQSAKFVISPSKYYDLDQARELFSDMQDLMIVLTNSELSLDWPWIERRGAVTHTRFYFNRLRSEDLELKMLDCWLLYPRIKGYFGKILGNWFEMSNKFGPGIYLLLGHRKGMRLYSEHQFVSMVWGLESLHRSLTAGRPKAALSEKEQRIVAQITPSSDRRWLKKKLEHATEPSLADRIVELFEALPLSFPGDELRNFADACAAHRNDISHYGGQRGTTDRDTFYRNIMLRGAALGILYQARVMQLICVPDAEIKWLFHESTKSFRLRYILWSARLAEHEEGFDGDQVDRWSSQPRA